MTFQLDAGTTALPAGTWLHWSKSDKDNNKAVYALLLSALIGGKSVRVYFNDDASISNAYGQFIHLNQ